MKGDAMNQFVEKHSDKVVGALSSADRIVFRGHLRPICWPEGLEKFLGLQGLLIKDFKTFAPEQSERIKQHAVKLAERRGRPFEYLSGGRIRKEDRARSIAEHDGITRGLVCVFSTLELCGTFGITVGKERPHIVSRRRKCLCIYFYLIDPVFGLMHVRLQSWFPFTIQICLNGHEWLARKMKRHDIDFRQVDNAFTWIADPPRAQRFADKFQDLDWPVILSRFAERANPLLGTLISNMDYYWVIDQAEFATDVMFQRPSALKNLYAKLLEHATLCFGAEDVMTFLGKRLNGVFKGEVVSDFKKRWPGARIKHRVKSNWIKMYDKHGLVLRVETVINDPKDFRVRRKSIRKGKPLMAWRPMAKGVANLYKYAEVAFAANRRYLDALAVIDDPAAAGQLICKSTRSIRKGSRSFRGFNPAAEQDVRLFSAVMRGEHAIRGFRNHDVRQVMFPAPINKQTERRYSAAVSRMLKRLHVHGLIAKTPRSRRWKLTTKGQLLMSMAIKHHQRFYPETIEALAA